MQMSMHAACLVLFVAVCGASSIQWGDSNPRFGVGQIQECNCNAGDWCEQRQNRLFMCRNAVGQYYAPLRMSTQDLIFGQGQKLEQCCRSTDYAECAVTGYRGVSSYITEGFCSKFYFNGNTCQQIDVFRGCVAALNPTNMFDREIDCLTKCGSVSVQEYATKGMAGQLIGKPINMFGQPMVSKGLVGHPIVSKGLIGHPIVSKGLIGRPGVSKVIVGQDYVNKALLSQSVFAQVGQDYASKTLASKPIIKVVGAGADCCRAADFTTCAVQGISSLSSYIHGQTCRKFYFSGARCEEIEVYTNCVADHTLANLFETSHACQQRCSAVGNQGYVSQKLIGKAIVIQPIISQKIIRRVKAKSMATAFVNQAYVGSDCCRAEDFTTCAVQGISSMSSYIHGQTCRKFYFSGARCEEIEVYTNCVADHTLANLFETSHACQQRCSAVGNQGYVNQKLIGKVIVNQPIISQKIISQPIIDQGYVQPVIGKSMAMDFVNQAYVGSDCCRAEDFTTCAVHGISSLSSYIHGQTCRKFYFSGARCEEIEVYTNCVADHTLANLFETRHACQTKCSAARVGDGY